METAHLTQAYDHARNAQHELAAGEFANAAKDTGDAEALRILNLLEHHHHRLASIIKSPSARTAAANNKEPGSAPNPSDSPAVPVPSTSASVVRSTSPTPSVSSPPKPTSRRRPSRDPSSSIATNLATARGIPGAQPRRGAPVSAALSATNAVANTPPRGERQSRADNQDSPYSARDSIQRQARRADESIRNSIESLRPPGRSDKAQQTSSRHTDTTDPSAHAPQHEEGFQRFYSTFENIFSAISAPLAFASLPLSPSTPSAPVPAPVVKTTRSTTTTETDLTTLISRPALRALKEDQGPSGPFANTAESFYVVPTSGGTVSYAGILTHQHPHPHSHQHAASQGSHLPDVIEEDTSEHGSNPDEFVDAVETPYPPSPTSPRHKRRGAKPPPAPSSSHSVSIPAGRGTSRKTMEELELENTTLRALLDKQSRRLQMWEATSQSQSLALAQSFRARGPALAAAVSDPSALAQAIAMGMGVAPPLPSPSRTGSTGARTPTTIPVPARAEAPSAASAAAAAAATAAATAKAVEEAEARVQELVAQVEALRSDKERDAQEIEKLTIVLARYREQWEKLKAGARGRRERERARELEREKEGAGEGGSGGGEEGEEKSGEGEEGGKE
ncbi:hypothetical protein AOQ84DRAFT_438384 [Glonium stellatum]|uniref:Uncharacterized protein n=1 Tax=Glonium stellatum TaxID=574774 RepID=A0A8E2F4G2_9PEZI|nr:hypothetical protein AOQ84DRAFT_438384 [Glonium stellatum]